MTVPCKDCPDRKLGCHDKCDKYQAFKREREAARERAMVSHEAGQIEYERLKRIRRRRHI